MKECARNLQGIKQCPNKGNQFMFQKLLIKQTKTVFAEKVQTWVTLSRK